MVTTKKGKSGKMKIDLSTTTRVNTLGIRPQSPTMQQYATIWLDAAKEDAATATPNLPESLHCLFSGGQNGLKTARTTIGTLKLIN